VLESCHATLTSLDLVLCDINDAVGTQIAKCLELNELQLQGMYLKQNLVDHVYTRLTIYTGCSALTAPVIDNILRSCTKLYRVGLSGCKISDNSMKILLVENLAKQGRGIHTLLLGGCGVSDMSVDYLCQYPHVNTIALVDLKKTESTLSIIHYHAGGHGANVCFVLFCITNSDWSGVVEVGPLMW
jgi:hypothetical protein